MPPPLLHAWQERRPFVEERFRNRKYFIEETFWARSHFEEETFSEETFTGETLSVKKRCVRKYLTCLSLPKFFVTTNITPVKCYENTIYKEKNVSLESNG